MYESLSEVLGEAHPDAIDALTEYCDMLHYSFEKKPIRRKLYYLCEQTFGENHYKTIWTMQKLVYVSAFYLGSPISYDEIDPFEYFEILLMQEKVLAYYRRTLGDDNEETVEETENLEKIKKSSLNNLLKR